MTSCRTILRYTVLFAFVAALMAQVAQANPMLSGYGGPGEGSQAILGSTLINPPAGGGGATGGARLASPASSSETSGGSAGAGTARGAPAGGSRTHGAKQKATQRLNRYATPPAGEIRATSDTLGLSGMDLVYAILVLCGLVLAAVVTHRVARSAHRERTER